MRFRFESSTNQNTPYRIRIVDSLVVARAEWFSPPLSHVCYHWKWHDGQNYELRCPRSKPNGDWFILNENQELCRGEYHVPSFQEMWRWKYRPRLEWQCQEQRIVDESLGFCSGCLREQNGRRLCIWRHGICHTQGVFRDRLSDQASALLFGMLIASVFNI